jgi:hypothetical protein
MFTFIESLLVMLIVSVASVERVINQTFNIINSSVVFTVLVLDFMFVRWRISIIRKRKFIRLHRDLIEYYIKRFFVIDLVSIIILGLDVVGYDLGYFKIVFYIKYVTLR